MNVKTPPRVRTQHASDFVNLETYTQDEHLIVSKAQDDKTYIGRVYQMSPLVGGGAEFGNVIVNIFKSAPDDSVIQVSLICSPDYNASRKFSKGKDSGDEIVQELISRHTKLIDSTLKIGWQDDLPALNERNVVISLAIPVRHADKPALVEAGRLQSEFLTNIKGCGFYDARPLSASEVLGVYRQFADIFSPRKAVELDELLELKVQAFGPDQRFDFRDPDYGKFGDDIFCATVTAKSYPKQVSHGLMNLVSGAPMNSGTTADGGGQRISTPFIMTTTIRVANQRKESDRVQKAIESRSVNQNLPFKLGSEDAEAILNDLNYLQKICSTDGDKFIYASMTAFVFGRTLKEVIHARTSLKGTLDKLGFDGRAVQHNALVRWAQSLPMNFAPGTANNLACEAIMPASSGACLLPIYGDNLGNGGNTRSANTGMVFTTRRGSAHFFDPFTSQSNKNGVLFARAGAGKSFTLQYMVTCALAEGTTVVLFDNGRSSKKFCQAVGGEFNEFSIGSGLQTSLNPFTGLSDAEFNDQQENITSLLLLMAFEDEATEPGARIALSEAVKAAHGQKSSGADINKVIDSLVSIEKSGAESGAKNQVVIAAGNLVPRLRAFMESPTRGQFFRGVGTLNPSKQFTVFELAGLSGDNHLRKCVLFFVMNMLMTRIKGIPGRKMIIVDEASDLLKDDGPAAVMEGLYRKGRKDNVSVWIVSQSPADMADNSAGQVILSQSAWKCVMAQESEEIDKVVTRGIMTKFAGDPFFNKLIKDITTRKGVYSEILIMGDNTYEAVRLYVDRFTSSLFSSEGDDRDGVFALMEIGMSAVEAVYKIIGDSSKRRKNWIASFVNQLRVSDGLSEAQILEEVRESLK